MSTLNRTIAPQAHAIHKVDLVQPTKKQLNNGTPFYELKAGSQQVLRLEFIFSAGTRFQSKPLVASFANAMLVEGTSKKSAMEIAEAFDYYGAFVAPEFDNDRAGITLHCLSHTFPKVFPLLAEILEEVSFPENELRTNLNNGRQKYMVNAEKVDVMSRKKFMEAIFGKGNPYGMQAEVEDFNNISRQDLIDFYQNFYRNGELTILASGQFGDEVFQMVNALLGNRSTGKIPSENDALFTFPAPEKIFVPKDQAIQTGIRIGRQMLKKNHPDYPAMQVLNTALGGYFGSRLMANIREDKGYTYGIGSAVAALEKSGYFFIATEVGADVANAAVEEIYKELARLRNEPIPKEELHMVTNYMLGSFLQNSDGPFAMADRFKGVLFHGLDYTYYDRLLETINSIRPERLMELANQNLKDQDLTEVLAGKK
jgi:predicted Zn-dependent peptidase